MTPSQKKTARLPLLAAALLVAGCGPQGSHGPDAPRRNVLLVTLDTTRPDRLGCYGYEAAETPALDALAARSVRFDNAISTAGITPMAHASILSGLNPYRHGLRVFAGDAGNRMAGNVPTLATELSAAGWATAAFVSAYTVKRTFGLDRGFAEYDSGLEDFDDLNARETHEAGLWKDARIVPTQRRGDATTDAALAWLDENGGAEQPAWFLWAHYFDVHDYNVVPPEAWAAERGVQYDSEVKRNNPDAREALYDLEMTYMDAQVGRILDKLEQLGLRDDTIVVVIADHGQGLKDGLERHGWLRHRLLYQWSVQVPLLVYVPGMDSGAVASLVRNIDVFPTVMDALGLEVPGDIEGRSLLPLMRGEDLPAVTAYADALNTVDEHSPNNGLPEHCRDDLFMVIDGRWKLIHHKATPANTELFDLEADPLERENVAARFPEERARLEAWLERAGAMNIDRGERQEGLDTDSLHQLGYTGGDEEDE